VTSFAALTFDLTFFVAVVAFLTVFGLLGATAFFETVLFLAAFGLLGATAFLVTAFFLAVFGLLGTTAFLATVAFLVATFDFFGADLFLAVFALDFLTIWFTNNSLAYCDEQ
jgi:hypothetical protein